MASSLASLDMVASSLRRTSASNLPEILVRQTKDLFLGSSDGEFASAVNVLVVRQVESAEACFGEISQEDVPSFAKVGLPHLVAPLEVCGGVQHVFVVVFVGQARAAEFSHFFDLCSGRFWPDVDVPVITIKDEVRHECKSGEVERHPDVNVVRGCCVFSGRPEQ